MNYIPKAFIGKPAPEFSKTGVLNHEMKTFTLNDLLEGGKSWGILLFHGADFSIVCPTELNAFSDAAEEFKKRNCNIFAISTDSEYCHMAWTETPRTKKGIEGFKYPLLEDKTKSLSKDYGVLKEEMGIPARAMFIINPKGIICQITINDSPVGKSSEEALRLLDAFQFHESHQCACAGNWKPGMEGIKPDPKQSQAYFEKHYK